MTTPELWKAYVRIRSVTLRNQLVCLYMPLARHCAFRLGAAHPSNFDEFKSAAYAGLIQAVEGFNPDRKIAFRTYAAIRIFGAIKDWQREIDEQSRAVRTFARNRDTAVQTLTMMGTDISPQAIAQYMNISLKKYLHLEEQACLGNTVHLSAMEENRDEPYPVYDTEMEDPSEVIGRELLISFIKVLLPEPHCTVILLYFFGGLTNLQIGQKRGLCESRISQIRGEGEGILRQKLLFTQFHDSPNLLT